jgi:hypothetical protein
MSTAAPGDGEPIDRLDDDLIGLDFEDPEARAFASHLDRMRHLPDNYTVEGYLQGIGDFADSANRTVGLQRLITVTVVLLLLGGVVWTVYVVLGVMWTSFLN